jgi:hypothetical protein
MPRLAGVIVRGGVRTGHHLDQARCDWSDSRDAQPLCWRRIPAFTRFCTHLNCATGDEALDVGDDEIELLLEQGWRPEDLVLTRSLAGRTPKREGHRAYWDTDRESYSDVLGFERLDLAILED